MLSFFRQDTAYFGRDVKVGELALHSMLARSLNLKCRNRRVLWLSRVGWTVQTGTSAHVGTVDSAIPLSDLARLRAAAASRLSEYAGNLADHAKRIGELEKKIESEKDPAEKKKHEAKLRETKDNQAKLKALAPLVEAYDALNKSSDELLSAVARMSTDAQLSLFERLQSVATLLTSLQDVKDPAKVFFLASETAISGGSYRTRRNLVTTLFSGDLLSYSGGAAVAFALFDGTARLVTSDTLTTFTGFGKFPKKQGSFVFNSWESPAVDPP